MATLFVVAMAGCQAAEPSPAVTGPGVTSPGGSAVTESTEPMCGEWTCAQQARFTAAGQLIERTPGYVGIVVRDRVTGAVWLAGAADRRIWAGSTPKLALALALREQARAGEITLDATAERQLAAMLKLSDNRSADALWNRYVDAAAMMARFPTAVRWPRPAGERVRPAVGFVKCGHRPGPAHGLHPEQADPADRAYLVTAMRGVDRIQHWGVWGAGAALRPGVKDGWSVERDSGADHWITATVGFAGDDERYVIAAMYHQLPGGDTIERGVQVLTDVVATVFGAPVPAPVVVPSDY
jgi:hypothetical protein